MIRLKRHKNYKNRWYNPSYKLNVDCHGFVFTRLQCIIFRYPTLFCDSLRHFVLSLVVSLVLTPVLDRS